MIYFCCGSELLNMIICF